MVATPETGFIILPDQRKIAYCTYGKPNGYPVFYFHGTPGSRIEPFFAQQAGLEYGFRIIAPDRPGLGRSDPQPGRTLLSWADDVIQIADQLGMDQFGVIGASGGGPHVLACASAVPERLSFAGVLGSWAPVTQPELAAAMAPLDQFFFRMALYVPRIFSIPFAWIGLAGRYLPPRVFVRFLDSSLCDADRILLKDKELAEFFQQDIQEAFKQGVRGPAAEALLLYQDWGFQLEDISTPVHIIHGTEDKFAPFLYGEYLHQKIKKSIFHPLGGQGHLHFIKAFEDVLSILSAAI